MELKLYSGHIRNWRKLGEELGLDLNLPRQEREESIILAAYQKWGKDMAKHIYGMYAFAIWDEANERLFCLRDQFGTKPFFYYYEDNKPVAYHSSIREILKTEGVKKELNEKILQLYLTFTYVPGEETFFKHIFKLMPGHHLTWDKNGLSIERYFTPNFQPDETKSLEDWSNEIHNTLTEIIKEVKEEDEEVASFLSGGVDSSYVLAMSEAEDAYSCGYEEERFDESRVAVKTAELLNRKFHRRVIQPEEYFESVFYVMENMEQPLGDASALVFALGAISTAKEKPICYSGEGADEFFGGYNMYRNAERYGDNLKDFYVGNTNIMKEDEKERLLLKYDPTFLPIQVATPIYEEMEGLDPLTKMSKVDILIWLEGDIYLNVDKMSEAAGLEVRMPLTDLRIFDIASRMPSRFKVNEEENKVAFRHAAAKVLPEEITFRKKLGFIVPIRIWMADDRYNKDIRERIFGASAAKFFNLEEVKAIYDSYIGGESDHWRKLWTIYTFLVWYDIYFN